MQVWNVLHAARRKYRTQKWCKKNRHLRTTAQLCRAISSQLRHVSTIGKKTMVNFGPLVAEIVSLVWGTPANFSGFRVLAALLHSTLLVGSSQTAALNRGRHLYSAGRPSHWALAHISSFSFFTAGSLGSAYKWNSTGTESSSGRKRHKGQGK